MKRQKLDTEFGTLETKSEPMPDFKVAKTEDVVGDSDDDKQEDVVAKVPDEAILDPKLSEGCPTLGGHGARPDPLERMQEDDLQSLQGYSDESTSYSSFRLFKSSSGGLSPSISPTTSM